MKRFAVTSIALSLAALALVAVSLPVTAQPKLAPIVLDDATDFTIVGSKAELLEDPSRSLNYDDVSGPYAGRFTRAAEPVPNLGYTSSAWWLGFSVRNLSHDPEWYLEIYYPLIDDIRLLVTDEKGGFDERVGGRLYPFSEREVKSRNYIYKLNLEKGAEKKVIIRLASKDSLPIPVRIIRPRAFWRGNQVGLLSLGSYYGLILAMILFNLGAFLFIRDRSYLFYIGTVVFLHLLFILSLNGFSSQFIGDGSIWWSRTSISFFISMGIVFAVLFSKSFLNTREKNPVFHLLLNVMQGWALVQAALSLTVDYYYAIQSTVLMSMGAGAVTWSAGVASLYRGNRSARFYLIAWTALIVGGVIYGAKTMALLPSNLFTEYFFQAGLGCETILMTMALFDRINLLKEEKEKAQEEALGIQQTTMESLEQMVDERTAELRLANRKLVELDQIKSNFFANISHEIRTPLTLILSPVEAALQGDAGVRVDNAFLDAIQRNSIRLLRLINNLLDLSKIEAGRMMLRIREMDLVRLMRNYLFTVQSAAESRGIALEFVTSLESLVVPIDVEKIDKIAMNLISNALKFTDSGGRVRISLEAEDESCLVEVADTGEGIPAGRIDAIFDRFGQAQFTPTRKFEGTGIGLSLVKELLQLHGGTVSVTSRYIGDYPDDHGSVFSIRLPRSGNVFRGRDNVEFISPGDAASSDPDQRRFVGMREMYDLKKPETGFPRGPEAGAREGRHTGPERQLLLVVEDNPDMLSFLMSLLEPYYDVICAVDGNEGLAKIRTFVPSLVVTDAMMPGMNGFDLTKAIKGDESLRGMPVIILTALSDMTHRIDGLEFGADDYIVKPFNSKELLARIRSLLRAHEFEKIIHERNREMEDDLETARLVQQKILPARIPDIQDFRTNVAYIPMDKVGGDFYDFKVSDGRVELFIADGSGHGLPGALLSMISKIAFDGIAERTSASSVICQVNDVICRSTVRSNFITAFYAIIDRETMAMHYCNAGHNPPIVYRSGSREFFELKSRGNPMGWFTPLSLEEGRFQVIPGDRIVLYTDGLTECSSPTGEMYGSDRLKDFISSSTAASPEEFSSRLVTHLKNFSGQETFNDDLCVLVVDVLGGQQVH